MNEKLYELYSEFLPKIDQTLAQMRIPIQERPIKVIFFICEHYLVSIDDKIIENIKDYFSKIWFGVFLRVVEKWYRNKYGNSFDNEQNLNGVIILFNTPFLLSIPKTINTVNEDETFSVRFLDRENPLDWIDEDICISVLNNVEKTEIINNIKAVSTLTCAINMNLLANFPTKKSMKMLNSIFTHINSGVNNIIHGWNNEETIYVWEFHLAIEKSMKVYLQQQNIKYKNTHSLEELNRVDIELIPPEILNNLPHHTKAISYRYNEGITLTEKDTMNLYLIALEAINNCMQKYQRKFNMSKATIVFKRPE